MACWSLRKCVLNDLVEGFFLKCFNLIKWVLVLIKETLTPQNQFYKALG